MAPWAIWRAQQGAHRLSRDSSQRGQSSDSAAFVAGSQAVVSLFRFQHTQSSRGRMTSLCTAPAATKIYIRPNLVSGQYVFSTPVERHGRARTRRPDCVTFPYFCCLCCSAVARAIASPSRNRLFPAELPLTRSIVSCAGNHRPRRGMSRAAGAAAAEAGACCDNADSGFSIAACDGNENRGGCVSASTQSG